MRRRFFLLLTLLSFLAGNARTTANDAAELVSVKKIWDQAPHNAFTDLVRFQNRWYCVFREGQGHVSPDGALRVISSTDGERWESAALLTSRTMDLRDAKITVTPDQRLMLSGAGALHDRLVKGHQSLVWFSSDGKTWSDAFEIGDPNFWLWRTTWQHGKAYSIGYNTNPNRNLRSLRLYESRDGVRFEPTIQNLFDLNSPGENTLRFLQDGTAVVLLRRDAYKGDAAKNISAIADVDATAFVGTASPPYRSWTWRDLGQRIGGPNFVELPDGRLVAAVRWHEPKSHTALCWFDPAAAKLSKFMELPSGGDTSYAGLALHDGLLWVSYYSSHERKSNIYLAQVRVAPLADGAALGSRRKTLAPEPVATVARDIGSRRELFVDRFLIESLRDVSLKLHEPKLAPSTNEPADNLEYGTVIKDGDLFRLYTREHRGAKFDGDTTEVTRYCESRDGIHWTKPILRLYEIDGSKENNVILHEAPFCHNFSPMLDNRPGVPADERFKALAGTVKSMLYAFASADGIHWRKLRNEPVIRYTKEYAFDSQNVSFWSEAEQCYVCYFRHFLEKKLRSVCRTTSKDYITWTEPTPLRPNFPGEHIYTTLTHPYYRAPHIYIATPTRFHPDRGMSTDILFMTARGDAPFDRTFRDAFIRPGLDPARWGNRSNYAALNFVPTGPHEMSLYATPFRRFTLRPDGFVSAHAGADSGELRTHPLKFAGTRLSLNVATSAAGSVLVEVQDAAGQPLSGYTATDCTPFVGDTLEHIVAWKKSADLSSLAGQTIRLRFVLREADLYAIQFQTPN